MGAINYKTSEYITIGYNLDNFDYDDEFYFDIIQDDYESIKELLKHQHFYYFHVVLDVGYYNGFSIDIECNFDYYFDNWQDKRDAQKEITQLKAFLKEIIENYNCCVVAPSWCTTYYNYTDSMKKLNDAVKEMREHIKTIPTWNILKIRGEI
jgi:hypothetical protein